MVAFQNYSRPKRSKKSKRPTIAEGAGAMATEKKASKPKRPKMTAAEALSFGRFSIPNALAVHEALKDGGRCNGTCEPYQDVFTYARWQALGCQVRKGERGIKIPVIVTFEYGKENDETGETETVQGRKGRMSTVFCACQVEGEYVVDLRGGSES